MKWKVVAVMLLASGYLEAQTVSFANTYDMSNAVPPDVSVETPFSVDVYPGGYIMAGVFAEVVSTFPLTIDTASFVAILNADGSVAPGSVYRIGGMFATDVKYNGGLHLLSGFTGGGDTSGVVVLLDPSASTTVWGKRLVINQSNSSPDVRDKVVGGIPLSSGEYAFVGESADDFGSGFDAIVFKTDNSGNLLWYHFFGGSSPYGDKARDVKELSSGDIVVAGISGGFLGNYSGFVALLSSSGTVLWSNAYGTVDDEYLFAVQPTSDGGFVAAGDHMVGADTNVLVIKLDASGSVVWAYSYGDPLRKELGRGVVETSDGYVISGTVDGDILLFKIDVSGNVVWARSYGGPGIEVGSKVVPGHGGGFAIAGVWNAGTSQDGMLVKTLEDGRVLETGGGSCTYQGDISLFAQPLSVSTTPFPTLSRTLSLTNYNPTISAVSISQSSMCPLGFDDPLSAVESPHYGAGYNHTAIYGLDGRRIYKPKGLILERGKKRLVR